MGFWSNIIDTVSSNRDGEYYIARRPDRVGKFLQFMMNARCFVSVVVPGTNDTFRSVVVSVNIKDEKFQLDELTPSDGNEIMVPGKKIKIMVESKGLNARLTSSIIQRSTEDGLLVFECEIPHEIRYKEDRQHYRYLLGVKRSEFSIVETPGQKTRGAIFDVSEGGLGVLLDGGYQLKFGASYPVFINFENYDRIVTEMVVRHITPDKEETSKRRVGLEFVKLESKDAKIISELCESLNCEFLQRIFK